MFKWSQLSTHWTSRFGMKFTFQFIFYYSSKIKLFLKCKPRFLRRSGVSPEQHENYLLRGGGEDQLKSFKIYNKPAPVPEHTIL